MSAKKEAPSLEAADAELLVEFRELWRHTDELWNQHENEAEWSGYVSADYEAVFRSLISLRHRATTFLEWGSGFGIVTIMASRLGYEAYGIEAKPKLAEYATELAASFGPEATLVEGSFIPDGFEWEPAETELSGTETDLPAAYNELDMELQDFDLVYAFPWPSEHGRFRQIMHEFARPDAMLLTYDAREGMEVATAAECGQNS